MKQRDLSGVLDLLPAGINASVDLSGDFRTLDDFKNKLEKAGYHGFYQSTALGPVILTVTDSYHGDTGPSRNKTPQSRSDG